MEQDCRQPARSQGFPNLFRKRIRCLRGESLVSEVLEGVVIVAIERVAKLGSGLINLPGRLFEDLEPASTVNRVARKP